MSRWIDRNRHTPECKLLLAVVDMSFTELVRYYKIKRNGRSVTKVLRNEILTDLRAARIDQFWNKQYSKKYLRYFAKVSRMSKDELNNLKIWSDYYEKYGSKYSEKRTCRRCNHG